MKLTRFILRQNPEDTFERVKSAFEAENDGTEMTPNERIHCKLQFDLMKIGALDVFHFGSVKRLDRRELPEFGSRFRMLIQNYANPHDFTFNVIDGEFGELEDLTEQMTSYYESETIDVTLARKDVRIGQYCACTWEEQGVGDGRWYRAKITKVHSDQVCSKSTSQEITL